MANWEHVAHSHGINIHGSWFDATTGKPLPSIISFAMDQRHTEFMKKFHDLEPGQIISDRKFYKWLHKDFRKNFVTKTRHGDYVFEPTKTVCVKLENV